MRGGFGLGSAPERDRLYRTSARQKERDRPTDGPWSVQAGNHLRLDLGVPPRDRPPDGP